MFGPSPTVTEFGTDGARFRLRLLMFESVFSATTRRHWRCASPEAIVAELAGHAHGNIDRDRYGHGFEAGQLKEAIEKLSFGIEEELKKLPLLTG